MARRVLYAQRSGYHSDSHFSNTIFLDRWIEVDWKHKVYVDAWSGDAYHKKPSFAVGTPQTDYGGGGSTLTEYGVIKEPEDVSWLTQATHGSYIANEESISEVKDVVARIHQTGLRRDGKEGFEVEVLTGEDAKVLINRDKRAHALQLFKELWWVLAAVIIYFWWRS